MQIKLSKIIKNYLPIVKIFKLIINLPLLISIISKINLKKEINKILKVTIIIIRCYNIYLYGDRV